MVEINDTLQLTADQGFPTEVFDITRHREHPITLDDVKDRVFTFVNKPTARIFQLDPVRVFFVQNVDDEWLFWGHALIQSTYIDKDEKGNWVTSGSYKVVKIYPPDYQEATTRFESPAGLSYFGA